MKTAISIPDDTFELVERRAAAMGVSRSEFYTSAARVYLEQLESEGLASKIDAALELVGGGDDTSRAAVAAGRRRLADLEDEW